MHITNTVQEEAMKCQGVGQLAAGCGNLSKSKSRSEESSSEPAICKALGSILRIEGKNVTEKLFLGTKLIL